MFPEFGKQTDTDRLFILCDGMGGHDAGEVASATVCEAMSKSILNDGHDKDGEFTTDDFDTAIDKAFIALDKKDTGAEKKMGTTMTFLKLHNGGAFIAHMGDSRVYHIRPGKDGESTEILHETSDHSLVNDLIKIGELSKKDARNSNQKNIITRAMQPNMGRRPKAEIYRTADIRPGDYFYMCSDGMLEQAEMEDGSSLKNVFSEMGGSDENKVEILKSVTEKNRDNHTAFIIHITDVIDPIQESAESSSIAADKFAAIVEDEQSASGASDADKNHTTAIEESDTEQLGVKGGKGSGHRKIAPMVIRFVVAAVAVIAIFVAVNSVRSCITKNDNKAEETIEIGTDITVEEKDSEQPSGKGGKHDVKPEASQNATSVTTGNSPTITAPATGGNNSQQTESLQEEPSHSAPPQKLPEQLLNNEGVVSSDTQLIQDKIKKDSITK